MDWTRAGLELQSHSAGNCVRFVIELIYRFIGGT